MSTISWLTFSLRRDSRVTVFGISQPVCIQRLLVDKQPIGLAPPKRSLKQTNMHQVKTAIIKHFPYQLPPSPNFHGPGLWPSHHPTCKCSKTPMIKPRSRVIPFNQRIIPFTFRGTKWGDPPSGHTTENHHHAKKWHNLL